MRPQSVIGSYIFCPMIRPLGRISYHFHSSLNDDSKASPNNKALCLDDPSSIFGAIIRCGPSERASWACAGSMLEVGTIVNLYESSRIIHAYAKELNNNIVKRIFLKI